MTDQQKNVRRLKNHRGYSFTLIEINTRSSTVIIFLAQSAQQQALCCVLFHRVCCYYRIKTLGFIGSELGQNSHTKAERERSVYAMNTHPSIHVCFVRGCYETSASSMAVVFPTAGLCSQETSKDAEQRELKATRGE